MGSQARRVAFRNCKTCGKPVLATSAGLVEHSKICKRLDNLGLYSPNENMIVKVPKRGKNDWNQG